MDTLLQDLRYAVRMLLRAPGFTFVAVLTLALGIGANTAIFSVLYGVLLRPLPYPEPERLVTLEESWRGSHDQMSVTYREFRFLEEQGRVFAPLAATTSVGFNIAGGSAAERVRGLRVSRDYFRALGVQPAMGRGFTDEEDQPGGSAAVVLSHGLWVRRFGADTSLLGRTILLDGHPAVVVGVMAADFDPVVPVEAWSTLAQVGRTIGSGQNLEVIARLTPGLSLEAARAGFQPTLAAFRDAFHEILGRDVAIELVSYRQSVASDVRTPVRILFGAIGFVLLIACANVANLVLGRTVGRTRELAVRVAVGASRSRVVRQLLTESVVLALLGGALGLAVADWSLGALLAVVPPNIPRIGDIHLDGWTLLFTFAVSLATGAAFGLLPAWHMTRTDLHGALKESAGRTTAGTHQGRLRGALVVAETAMSLILLVGAGLLMETFTNLMRTEPGFDPRRVVSAEIWLTGSRYDSAATITQFYRSLTDRLAVLPGVQSAAIVEAGLPLERGGNLFTTADGGAIQASVDYRTITPAFFTALGVPLQRGRVLTDADGAGAEPVAVVNASFARRFLSGEPLGRMVSLGHDSPARRVVGVVGDVRSFVGRPAPPTVFITSAQTPIGYTRIFSSWFPIHVLVRTVGDPAAMKGAVARVIQSADAQVPLGKVRTMEEVLAGSLGLQRFLMTLIGLFAALAIVLAAVGLYGVMSYLVAQRTHEIGVRMALGAPSREVLGLVVGRGMLLASTGALVGVAGALALTRLLRNQLYGVQPGDALTFAGVTGLLLLVALAACLIPARRATRMDPLIALRSE
jgi:putative ABC transport system permease protein